MAHIKILSLVMFNDLSFFFSQIMIYIYVVEDNFIFINEMFFVRFRS